MSNENKIEDAIKGMHEIRTLVEAFEKKNGEMDVETKAQIKAIGDEASKAMAEHQAKGLEVEASVKKYASELDAVKEQCKDMYKVSSRMGVGTKGNIDAFDEVYNEHRSVMSEYIRKGTEPGSNVISEIAVAFVDKSMRLAGVTDDLAAKMAVHTMISEQSGGASGKGFFYAPETKSMVTGINPDGGYFVNPDFRTDITITREFETSPMRAISQIITTGTNEVEIPIDDNEGISGGWVGEITARPETDTPQVGMKKIPVHEQFANPKISQKMLDDAPFNIEAWLSEKTSKKFARDENTAFVVGNGSLKPRGFLDYPNWTTPKTYQRDALEQIASGAVDSVTADGAIKLKGSLKGDYQAGAVFLTQRDTFTDLSLLKDGQGRYLLSETMLPDGVDVRLLGKPLFFADDMAAVAADALALAYGDFGTAYTIVDRMGIRILRNPFTDIPFIRFYTTKRVGGDLTNFEGIKIQKLAVTL